MSNGILVIGHAPDSLPIPVGFKFVMRRHPHKIFAEKLGLHNFNNSSQVWSEYSAWFENFMYFSGKHITGVCHYRCAINLTPIKVQNLPFFARKFVLGRMISKTRDLKNFLFVGTAMDLNSNMLQQFVDCHPAFEEALRYGACIFDELTQKSPGTTLNRLMASRQFFVRNIFLTDTDFTHRWTALSFELAKSLDRKFDFGPTDRWGGFVLERFFSLFIEDYSADSGCSLISAPLVYFNSARLTFFPKINRGIIHRTLRRLKMSGLNLCH